MKKWFAIYSDMLHMQFSERFLQLPESAKKAYSPKHPLVRLLRVFGYIFLRLVGNIFLNVERPPHLKGKIWLYVVSQNNYDSLKFLQEKLPDTVSVAGQSKSLGKYKADVERISLRSKILHYYKLLPLVAVFLKYKRQSTLRFYDVLFDAVGFYEVYLHKLRKYAPQAIVFANDHNADARAMLLAARKLGIKTIYIQHASVSTMFPPLSFDLSLLEGQDSLDKYTVCGPIQGQVRLIGMPKADEFVSYRNTNKVIRTIGIGFNVIDELAEAEKLLSALVESLPKLTIIFRPHPRDTRNFASLTNISQSIRISDSRTVTTFDYIKQIDVQISATSGIHLEAVLLNVWSIYYDFSLSQELNDYYGYIKHGLVDVAGTTQELIQHIQQKINAKPDVLHRAKYYNATVDSLYDGQSSELATNYIATFLLN